MNYDFKNSNASRELLIELLASFVENASSVSNSVCLSQFKKMWDEHLAYGIYQENIHIISLTNQYFPLEHSFFSNYFVIYFHVQGLQSIISDKIVPSSSVPLSKIKDRIHYTKHDSYSLHDDALNTPIVVVQMYSTNAKGELCMGEVVDGNHRVSAANNLNIDIPITVLETEMLPSDAFRNETSWILYHLITGIQIISGGLFTIDQIDSYLKRLSSLLLCYLPLKSE